jgi:hypothetical protein
MENKNYILPIEKANEELDEFISSRRKNPLTFISEQDGENIRQSIARLIALGFLMISSDKKSFTYTLEHPILEKKGGGDTVKIDKVEIGRKAPSFAEINKVKNELPSSATEEEKQAKILPFYVSNITVAEFGAIAQSDYTVLSMLAVFFLA